jgi:hypothetical protein
MISRTLLATLLLAMTGTSLRAEEVAKSKSALESDPAGWVDLLSASGLDDWVRTPIAPDTKFAEKNPWKVESDGKVLICDGVGIKEMLLHKKPRQDGIFHVEWRFKKVDGKADYNSGVYVRSKPDGKIWVQAQVAHLPKAPRLADLFADVPSDAGPKRVVIEGTGYKFGKEPGEWNTYEVTCKGPKVTVWLNGTVVTTWDQCPLAAGHVGLQAEFYVIEFRNLKFKESK